MSDLKVKKESLGQQLLSADPNTKIHILSRVHGVVLEGYFFPDILYEILDESFLERDDINIFFSEKFDCWSLYFYD